jgi:hypothetical protein
LKSTYFGVSSETVHVLSSQRIDRALEVPGRSEG